jgi:hypothetical protein
MAVAARRRRAECRNALTPRKGNGKRAEGVEGRFVDMGEQ